jgi:putative phage-type endonuclease
MARLIEADQGSDEWKAARVGIATASRFGDIMAKTRSGYAASRKNYMAELVVERLTGQAADNFKSSAMEWGTETEPVARLEYTLATGNEVEETGLWVDNEIGASPDGFVNSDGTLEIKCPNTATHLETLMSKKVPRQYYAQIQGQLLLTQRSWCDFVSYDPRLPENAQMIIIRVERDQDFIKELKQELKTFLKEVEQQVNFVKEYNGKD